MALAACGAGCGNPAAAAALAGGSYASGTGGFAGGLTGSGPEGTGFGTFGQIFGLSGGVFAPGNVGTSTSLNANLAAAVVARIDAALGGSGGSTFTTAASQGLQGGATVEVNFHFGGFGPATLTPFFGGVLAGGLPAALGAGGTSGPTGGALAIQTGAELAAAAGILATGATLARAGAADLGAAGGETLQAIEAGGPFVGTATALVVLSDGTLALTVGFGLIFGAGALAGVAINDATAPTFGGPTYHELGYY